MNMRMMPIGMLCVVWVACESSTGLHAQWRRFTLNQKWPQRTVGTQCILPKKELNGTIKNINRETMRHPRISGLNVYLCVSLTCFARMRIMATLIGVSDAGFVETKLAPL